jgi:predicted phage terminase large subunit-like protein
MSETARAETLAWYNEVVENLGDSYTHIEVVGTILHPDSLLATLVRSPHFEGRVYRSVEAWAERGDLWDRWRTILANPSDAGRLDSARSFFLANREAMLRGTRVLWERKESYEQLMMQLATRGRVAFFKEKQNEPLSAGSRVFDTAAWLRFIHDEAGGQLSFPSADAASGAPVAVRALRVCGFLDPALGGGASRRRGDFAAIVTVATDGAGAYFVLDAWIDRAPPARQIERIFDLHARWHFDLFGYEANHFQSLLAAPIELERARRREHGRLWQLPLRAVRHTERKEARIAALEPLAANGWLRFSRSLPEEFFAQADAFPCGRHDDAIDALAGAVELAKSFSCGTGIVTLRGRRSVRAKGY